ncbi:hypothetical protein N9I89_01345, partial [Porticoccaceae bacterium]|nr:hypothetical protein [Porticoccaceae bacterium]
MCHLISVVSSYISGILRNMKSSMLLIAALFISSFAVVAQAEDINLTVAAPEGSTSVRLTGPLWGWDPNGGPEAISNGDGTWSVALSPAENMEYLWVVDGSQENLIDNAANAECTAEIDGGAFNTDYANYANRIWVLGTGDASSTYDACAGTALAFSGPDAPTPTQPADEVISVFSDAYTDLTGGNLSPLWDAAQTTQVSVSDVITYATLNFQGIDIPATDVSTKEYLHVDFYVETPTSDALDIYLISAGLEKGYQLLTPTTPDQQWVSVNIPLTHFDNVNLTSVNQFKIVGNGTILFDNIYFHGTVAAAPTYNVTFSVDMTGIDLRGEVPTLQANFNGWCGGCMPLFDADGDNIWSVDASYPAGSYEYKFALGNWVVGEIIPSDCPNLTSGNRSFTLSADIVLPTDSFSACPGDDPVPGGDVIFSVDMRGVDLGGQVPTLQGPFNNWCGDCAPMSDANNDGIWSVSTYLAGGDNLYKYALGAWVSQEAVPSDCSNTAGGNRSVSVNGDATLAVDVYSGCPSDFVAPDGYNAPVNTTVSFTATLPAGTTSARLHSEALGWDLNHGDGVATNNNDGTWTATIPAPWAAGTNYKWYADGAEENLLDDVQAGYCANDGLNAWDAGANRLYSGSGDVTGEVFGACSDTPVAEPPVSATIALPVDFEEAAADYEI